MLRWSDVDLKTARVRWRAENDKIGFEHTTALTVDAVQVLGAARSRAAAMGDAWVFPAARHEGQPTGRMMFREWWDLAETAAELEPVERRGWHSLRRSFATEMKHAPLRDLAYLGGWKSVSTVVEIYQQPDDQTMLAALASRRPIESDREWVINCHLELPPRRYHTLQRVACRNGQPACSHRVEQRTGRDSNSREAFTPTRFPGVACPPRSMATCSP